MRTFKYLYTDPKNITNPKAQAIIQEDIQALEAYYKQGWNINEPFYLNDNFKEDIYPINLAVTGNVYDKSIRWLLEKNAKVYGLGGRPTIVHAGFGCSPEIIELLVQHGANISETDSVGMNVLKAGISGSQSKEFFYTLKNLGLPIDQDKVALRTAISNGSKAIVHTLLDLGIDPNQCEADIVFPHNPTPVCKAAQCQYWDLVKLLVEHGANVKITDQLGYRPYNYAEQYHNQEMMTYLQILEPSEWHDLDMRKQYFQSLNIPQQLIDILASPEDKRNFIYDEDQNYTIIEITFNTLTSARLFCWQGKQFLDLLSYVNDYDPDGMLVWSIEDEKIASIDFEHDKLTSLSTWNKPEDLFKEFEKIF